MFFRAWKVNTGSSGSSAGGNTPDSLIRMEIGLVVTAENPKQNPRAMRYADGYGVKVVIDPRGKQ